MDTINMPIISNFKIFREMPEINTSHKPIRYKIHIFFLIILISIIYYYRHFIYNTYNNILSHILLQMHINSMGQLKSIYIPEQGKRIQI